MKEQEIQIDANAVIDKMAGQFSTLSKQLAILQVQYDGLRTENEKLHDVLVAYEDKKKLQEEK